MAHPFLRRPLRPLEDALAEMRLSVTRRVDHRDIDGLACQLLTETRLRLYFERVIAEAVRS